MSRQMTPQEKSQFREWFPNLNTDATIVTGESTQVYNCISWTVGVTDRWLWPGSSISEFDTFYRRFGLIRTSNGNVAAWGHSTSKMTHGCISGPSHGPRWESKCGPSLRIQHGLNELEGSSYGRVVAFYSKSLRFVADSFSKMEDISSMRLSAEEQKTLNESLLGTSEDLKKEFAEKFLKWKKSWFEGGLEINSDPHMRAVGKEFDSLIAMGEKIIPLVIEVLADSENFFALQLYDTIQTREKSIVQYTADDDRILEGEQGRAIRVIQTWLRNQ